MPELPSGTVAFLFTDIEGSTRRWQTHRDSMGSAVARHDELMRDAIERHGGRVFKTVGDAFCAAFPTIAAALAAADAAQRALSAEPWAEPGPIRVRMALHVGSAEERANDYFGPAVNRTTRLLSLGHGGQVLLTLPAAELVRDDLPADVRLRDMGEHRLKDLDRPERVFQLVASGLPTEFPPLKSPCARRHNLPDQPTVFVGREAEVELARSLLERPDVRLLTLTGPGGVGKTRLAVQIAAKLSNAFPDGVWFVDLGGTHDPALVPAAAAAAFGLREEGGGAPQAQLLEHLKEKSLLLVMDNFEHVLPAARFVAILAGACPRVRVLVTSRARLRIAVEQEYVVPPLGIPDPKRLPEPDHLLAYPAVELFVQRATATKLDFALTPENATAVAAICVALDGLPLAIELAAARVKLLPPQAMLSKLDSRLNLLTGGARDKAERQQTLRAAIAWSYDLLAEGGRQLLARLSVFAGGCAFEAAEAVCNADGSLDLFERMDALVEHSLVRQEETAAGEPRFRMLATIREFAAEKLDASDEADELRRTHAEYFLALAEAAAPELTGPGQAAWLDRLDTEHDNLRAALAWAQAAGDVGYGLSLTGALAKFWQVRGHLTEGRRWLDHALTADTERQPVIRIPALLGAGKLASARGDYDRAKEWLEEALALVDATGNLEQKASIVNQLANIALERGHFNIAETLYAESLVLCEKVADKALYARVLGNLGVVALNRGDRTQAVERYESYLAMCREQQDYEGMAIALYNLLTVLTPSPEDRRQAKEYGEESLHLARELGDKTSEAYALTGLALVAEANGELDDAIALHERSLGHFREMDDRAGVASVLGNLGLIIGDRGDHPHAAALLRESLQLYADLGDEDAIAVQLEGLAWVVLWSEQPMRAARLLGAAETIRDRIGVPLPDEALERHETSIARLRNELTAEELQAHLEVGRLLTIAEAVADGLASDSGVSQVLSGNGIKSRSM